MITLVLLSALTAIAGEVVTRTLPNGLVVATQEYRGAPGVSVRIYVRVGSALEEEFLGSGISHYCEHVVSGGTTTSRTEKESAEMVRRIGAQVNAYTSLDHTCYHAYCDAQHWRTALELLADWVMNCAMNREEVVREKGVITREINMGEEEPGRVAHKLLMATVFPASPLGVPTIGYRELFSSLTPEQLEGFYRRHYVPNKTTVVVVGNVPSEEVMAEVERLMGGWSRGSPFTVPMVQEPPQLAPRWASRPWPGEVAYLRVAWPTVGLTHPDVYALDVLAAVLGEGESARLTRVLKERRLAFDVGAYCYTPAIAPGPFVVWALVPKDKANECLDAILSEVEAVKHGVGHEEVRRARHQVMASYSFAHQSVEDVASRIGTDLIHSGDPQFSASYLQRVEEVRPFHVRRVAADYLVGHRMNVVCVGAEPLRTRVAAAASDTARGVQVVTLESGLKVVVRENPHVEVVSLVAVCAGGTRHETRETNGTFSLLSRMLTKGTRRYTASQITSLVESRGGKLEAGSGRETFWLRLDLLAKDVDFGIRLLGELLTRSVFPEEELQKVKHEVRGLLRNQENTWQQEALLHLCSTYFGEHPYGLNWLGSGEVIERLGRDDLLAAYHSYVRAGNCVVAVAGPVRAAQVVAAVSEALGDLRPGSCPPPPPAPVPVARTGRVVIPNQRSQVTVALGYPAPALGHADEYPLRLLDAITSGVDLPSGWLQEALRGQRDLVYFVHLTPLLYREAGMVAILAQCQPDLVDSVLGVIQAEMARAARGEFTEADVEMAKGEYLTAVGKDLQTMSDQAHRAANYELFGLGASLGLEVGEAVRRVSLADVRRVASTYLSQGVVVLVGPEPGN